MGKGVKKKLQQRTAVALHEEVVGSIVEKDQRKSTKRNRKYYLHYNILVIRDEVIMTPNNRSWRERENITNVMIRRPSG